jgi:hypothetical protein
MSRTRRRADVGCTGDRPNAAGRPDWLAMPPRAPGSFRFKAWAMRFRVLAMSLLLLSLPPEMAAARDCQADFVAWVKLSERRLQQPQGNDADRGACIPTEDVRKELLNGLARTRALCEAASSWTDVSPQQTKTMIGINENFIASLPVCRAQPAEKGTDWATKSSPAPGKRRAASPPCLQLLPSKPGEFALMNKRCAGESILAVIETSDELGKAVCKAYTIRRSLTLRTTKNGPPRVNHECVLSQDRCTKDRIGSMFPECDWAGP